MTTFKKKKNGGWGWWYMADASGKQGYDESLYHTVQALRALLEIHATDIKTDTAALINAAGYLLDHRNNEGLWSVA